MSSSVARSCTVTIRLNGTSENPWSRTGLRQNPFGQIAIAEYDKVDRLINSLDAEPIVDIADLKRRLAGCSEEFVELCIAQFRPGERTEFEVEFPLDSTH